MLGSSELSPQVATEVEVSNVWWDRLVGDNGTPLGRARQHALLDFGKRAVLLPGRRLQNERATADTLVSLEQDRILLRDAGRDVYRFGHDIIEDWILYRVLDQRRDDLVAYLREVSQPLGLIRAIQLLGCSLLEGDGDDWGRLVQQLEGANDLSPRWLRGLLTAPFVSARARELLDKAEPMLLADSARRLIELLIALRTVEVNPDDSLLPYIKKESIESGDYMATLMSQPVPRWRTWAPLTGWLLDRLDHLPANIRSEAIKIMEMWQEHSPPKAIHRKRISEVAFEWLLQEEKRHGSDAF